MAPLRTYSPDQVSIIISDRPITGFADGTFINVDREGDSFSDVAGASGEVARTKSNDRRGNIELTLMQTSPDNDYLSNLAREDEITGARPFNFMMRDQNGTSLYEAATAWFMKPAAGEFGKELSNRVWTIRCADLKMFSGGSNTSI